MEDTRSLKKELDGEVFISRQIWHFSSIYNMIRVIFNICTLKWQLNNYVSCPVKVQVGETEVIVILYIFVAFWYCTHFLKSFTVCLKTEDIDTFVTKMKNQFSFHNQQSFSFRIMAASRNKMKLAATSRGTPENTRNTQSQNALDPGKAQECISQVSEEIEERFTKNFPKNSTGGYRAFWVLCLNLTNLF